MVNVGDLWIEMSSNWMVDAQFLLLSASVLMRINSSDLFGFKLV